MYSKNKGLLLICSYVIFANWLYVGTLSFGFEPFAWSGAIAWGPRYFVPILPFITIILGQLLLHISQIKDRKKKVILKATIIGLAALGFFVNLVGTLVWYQYGIIYGWDKEQLHQFTNNMDIMTWNPYYSPIVLHTKASASDFVSTIKSEPISKLLLVLDKLLVWRHAHMMFIYSVILGWLRYLLFRFPPYLLESISSSELRIMNLKSHIKNPYIQLTLQVVGHNNRFITLHLMTHHYYSKCSINGIIHPAFISPSSSIIIFIINIEIVLRQI